MYVHKYQYCSNISKKGNIWPKRVFFKEKRPISILLRTKRTLTPLNHLKCNLRDISFHFLSKGKQNREYFLKGDIWSRNYLYISNIRHLFHSISCLVEQKTFVKADSRDRSKIRNRIKQQNIHLESILFQTYQGRVQKQNKKNGWINPSRLAGWGQPWPKIQKKKNSFQKKIQRKLKTLIFPVWGGQGRNPGCQSDFLTSTFPKKHFKRSRHQFCLQSSRQIW